MQIDMELDNKTSLEIQKTIQKVKGLKKLPPELIGELHDIVFYHPNALLLTVVYQDALTMSEKMAIIQTCWPREDILDKALPFNPEAMDAFVRFLIDKLVFDFEQKTQSSVPFSDETIRNQFAVIKKILKKPSSLKEPVKKELEKEMAREMVYVRLLKKPAVGCDFHFVCSTLWPFRNDLDVKADFTEYLIKQDLTAGFPDKKSQALLMIALLQCQKNTATNVPEQTIRYQNHIREIVWPFIQQCGCEHDVISLGVEGANFGQLSMRNEEEHLKFTEVLKRLYDFSIYKGRIALHQNTKESANPSYLSFDEYVQKLPLANAIRKSFEQMNSCEEQQKTGFLTGFFWGKGRDVDKQRHQNLSNLAKDVKYDLSACVDEIITFLKDKETLLDLNSRAVHLMRALAPLIRFDFEMQSAHFRKSPQDLRDLFCVALEDYFTPQSQVADREQSASEHSLELF